MTEYTPSMSKMQATFNLYVKVLREAFQITCRQLPPTVFTLQLHWGTNHTDSLHDPSSFDSLFFRHVAYRSNDVQDHSN